MRMSYYYLSIAFRCLLKMPFENPNIPRPFSLPIISFSPNNVIHISKCFLLFELF